MNEFEAWAEVTLESLSKRVRKLEKKCEKLKKRYEYLTIDMWEQELHLVNTDVELADKIDLLVKVTRKNQDVVMEWVRKLKAKGGEK